METLPVAASGSPKDATQLLMDLIREAVELQIALATAQSGVSPKAQRGLATSLRNMLGLVVDLTVVVGVPATPNQAHRPATHRETAKDSHLGARKLVVFPCGDRSSVKHFNRTVRHPVDLTAFGMDLEPIAKAVPVSYPLTDARLWGVMPRKGGLNESRYRRCQAGDIALFTGNKQAFCAASIRGKLRSSELARALWHTDSSGNTWEFIFLLSDPIELAIPYSQLTQALGYDSKFGFPSFVVLGEEASIHALQALDRDQLWV